ncbi:hypothetical protein [Brochothrix phage ADU4]|nr:hypothetical protein [Brochothrix phage ADU4]
MSTFNFERWNKNWLISKLTCLYGATKELNRLTGY